MSAGLRFSVGFFGYALMALLFFAAIAFPVFFGDFLAKDVVMIFLIEFIAIHSVPFTFMVVGKRVESESGWQLLNPARLGPLVLLYGFYSLFVAGFSMGVFGTILPLPFFWLSSAIKVSRIWKHEGQPIDEKYIASFVGFMLITFVSIPLSVAVGLASFLLATASGQILPIGLRPNYTLAAWGLLYFAFMALLEAFPKERLEKIIKIGKS